MPALPAKSEADVEFAKAVLAARAKERQWSKATKQRVAKLNANQDSGVSFAAVPSRPDTASTTACPASRISPRRMSEVHLDHNDIVPTDDTSVSARGYLAPQSLSTDFIDAKQAPRSAQFTLRPSDVLSPDGTNAGVPGAYLERPSTVAPLHDEAEAAGGTPRESEPTPSATRPSTTAAAVSGGGERGRGDVLSLLKARMRQQAPPPKPQPTASTGVPTAASSEAAAARGPYMNVKPTAAPPCGPCGLPRRTSSATPRDDQCAASNPRVSRRPGLPFRPRETDPSEELRVAEERRAAGAPLKRASSAHAPNGMPKRIIAGRSRAASLSRLASAPTGDRITVHRRAAGLLDSAKGPTAVPSLSVETLTAPEANRRVQFSEKSPDVVLLHTPRSTISEVPPSTVSSSTSLARNAPLCAPPPVDCEPRRLLQPKRVASAPTASNHYTTAAHSLGPAIAAGTGVTWEEERLLAAIAETNALLAKAPKHCFIDDESP
jgi:hypothetical protein